MQNAKTSNLARAIEYAAVRTPPPDVALWTLTRAIRYCALRTLEYRAFIEGRHADRNLLDIELTEEYGQW